jgi:phosphoribosylaminoimidazolecarboxamide formyltransferase / IMP cyclohydrolase
MRAILSVSDKTGIAEFGQGLVDLGWEIVSTGNTARALREAGVPVQPIEDLTGFPEILDGRVKTLHPAVHGGILARRTRPEHLATLAEHGIGTIDLVASNLYPFANIIAQPNTTLDDVLEGDAIDIGGPAMIRAAAKNFTHVLPVVSPDDYGQVLDLLRAGDVPLDTRRLLAARAFAHVSAYDALIAAYLRAGLPDERFPRELTIGLEKLSGLRYGENPHQQAAFYRVAQPTPTPPGLVTAQQLHGIELSYNNIMDADAAWGAASDFAEPCVAIIKHTVPCGLATHADLAEAYRRALSGDPMSAYGGVVATNRPFDVETAIAIGRMHFDIIVAPAFAPGALELLRKKKNLRLLATGGIPEAGAAEGTLEPRQILGGLLLQTPDRFVEDPATWRVATKRAPSAAQLDDLAFAWRAVKHVKSNAIVIASDHTLRGMGAGQPNRVVSVRLAAEKAGEHARGAILASDAYFPFADNVEEAAKAGITAIVQPGGSLRDSDTIAAADAAGLAMVFTGLRHFRH